MTHFLDKAEFINVTIQATVGPPDSEDLITLLDSDSVSQKTRIYCRILTKNNKCNSTAHGLHSYRLFPPVRIKSIAHEPS